MRKKRLKLKKWVKVTIFIILILVSYKPIKNITINTIKDVEQKQQAKEQAKQKQIDKLLEKQHFNINK